MNLNFTKMIRHFLSLSSSSHCCAIQFRWLRIYFKMLWRYQSFCFIILTFWLKKANGASCPGLEPITGVSLICQDPETGQTISCMSDLPPQTVAFYKCAPHYQRPFGESEGGRMTCQSTGEWGRYSQYEDFNCKIECGKPTAAVNDQSVVIVFGEVATRENFPWHVAIFRSEGGSTPYKFFCGGSLINPNKGFLVITAAHCVTSKLRTFRIRPLEDFRVVLGSVSSDFDTNVLTSGTQIFTVKAAKIHPSYNYDNIQNDVAIMKLNEKVQISDYVSPICFPTSEMANMQIQGTGLISGYGVDENTQISATLNFARLPVMDNSACNSALGKELTSIEFCAGYRTGSSICSGDSGGGLVFRDELTKRLFIQGIASNVDRRPLDDLKYCQNYNTFTRVSSFIDWIDDQLDEFFADDDSDNTRRPPRPSKPVSTNPSANEEFLVTVYKNIDDKDTFVQWRMKNCSTVPSNWNNGRYWVDLHGKCLQFFEGQYCSGKSLQLQSTQSSSIFEWNFPDYKIKTVRLCPKGSQKPSPSKPPTDVSQGTADGNDYEKVGLLKHNLYRTKHGVNSMIINENLNSAAIQYAYDLLQKSKLQPSGVGGENLFEINGSAEPLSAIVTQAVDLWYKTIDQYDWNSPSATSFSQLVWKATRELGIGVARSGRRTIVVARYSPPGNVFYNGNGGDRTKYFRENVLPPRK